MPPMPAAQLDTAVSDNSGHLSAPAVLPQHKARCWWRVSPGRSTADQAAGAPPAGADGLSIRSSADNSVLAALSFRKTEGCDAQDRLHCPVGRING